MSVSIRIPLTMLICGLSVLAALPMQAMSVDGAGQGSSGERPIINFYNISQATGAQAQSADLQHYRPNSLGGWLAKKCSNFFSRPFSTTTKVVGSAVILGAYTLLKKYCLADSSSTLSRTVNIGLNCLSALSGLHVLCAAGKRKNELAPGVLSLLLGATPVLVSDTLALKSGKTGIHESIPDHAGSTYMHGVTEGMRALSVVYAAGQCVSWCKNTIVRRCNDYLERERKIFSDAQTK